MEYAPAVAGVEMSGSGRLSSTRYVPAGMVVGSLKACFVTASVPPPAIVDAFAPVDTRNTAPVDVLRNTRYTGRELTGRAHPVFAKLSCTSDARPRVIE